MWGRGEGDWADTAPLVGSPDCCPPDCWPLTTTLAQSTGQEVLHCPVGGRTKALLLQDVLDTPLGRVRVVVAGASRGPALLTVPDLGCSRGQLQVGRTVLAQG